MRYLLIQYCRRPGGQIDEMVTVSKKIKTSDIQCMNLIMDFKLKKVEKCVIEGKALSHEWERLCEYYRKVYPVLVEQLEKDAPLAK